METCSKFNIPLTGESFSTELSNTIKDAIDNFILLAKFHKNIKEFILLNLIRISGLLTSPLLELGIRYCKVIIFHGNDHDIMLYLQIYNRDIEFEKAESANISSKVFEKSLIGKKDCVIVYNDEKETSEHKKANGTDNVKRLSELFVSQLSYEKENKSAGVPAICSVISDRLANSISGKEVMNINMTGIKNGCEIEDIKIMKIQYEIDKLIVNEFNGNWNAMMDFCKITYDRIADEACVKKLKYNESRMSFTVLVIAYCILNRVIRDYSELPVCEKEMQMYVYNILELSEKFDDKNSVVGEFKSKLNELLEAKQMKLISNSEISKGFGEEDNLAIVYAENSFLYFTDDIFDRVSASMSLTANSCALRKKLNESDLLKTNDDLKFKVTLYGKQISGIKRVTAVSDSIIDNKYMKNVFGGDSNFIPCVDDGKIERINVGCYRNDTDVFWSIGHNELMSKHLLAVGSTGTGKSFSINLVAKQIFENGHTVVFINYKNLDAKRELAEHGFGYDYISENLSVYNVDDVNENVYTFDEIFSDSDNLIAFTASSYSEEVEKLLDKLYSYVSNENELNIFLVCDEVHCLEYKKNSPLYKIMTMGRGVGISLISAFQTFRVMKPAQIALFEQASVKMFFRMNCDDAEKAARMEGLKPFYKFRDYFMSLSKRECVLTGSLENNDNDILNNFIKIAIPECKLK